MKVTAITAACYRPEAWKLSESYMRRQTRQPDQWLVLDDDNPATVCTMGQDYHFFEKDPKVESMPSKILRAIDGNLITGDAVIFWENDDYYKADWIQLCVEAIEKGYDLVGEGMAAYYNVKHRWWSECGNVHHAALCQTAMHRELLPVARNIIDGFHSPYWDTRIWQVECNKLLFIPKFPAERRVIGIKGTPGKDGYSGEHRDVQPPGAHIDPSLRKLWSWIGDEAPLYSRFWDRSPL